MNNKDSFFQYTGLSVLFILIFALFISGFGVYHLIKELPKQDFTQNLSFLGQFISGSSGALLSFAGIIMLIKNLKNQFKAIDLQKIQLDDENLRNKKVVFNNTFFELLKLYENIIANMRFEILVPTEEVSQNKVISYGSFKSDYLKGKEVFTRFYSEFNNKEDFFYIAEHKPINVSINIFYTTFNKENAIIFQNYYRTLFYIFNYISEQKYFLSTKEQEFYANIIRAQFTPEEILFLFYNCLSSLGFKYFKPLVEDYGLLRNINVDDLIEFEKENQIKLYDKKAYGGKYPI